MGSGMIHYKTLMRKNLIIWKRTWLSSLLELICPIALMSILCLARLAVDKVEFQESSFLDKGKIFVPLAGFNRDGSNKDAEQAIQTKALSNFLQFGQIDQYSFQPVLTFFPKNCQQNDNVPGSLRRSIIAYTSNNSLTDSIIQEIKVLAQQQKLYEVARQQTTQIEGEDGENTTTTNSTADQYYIPYEFKPFNNEDEMRAYITNPIYMRDDDTPGICFGFQIDENSDSDYEVKLFFDDRDEDLTTQGIPSQLNPPYDIYSLDSGLSNFGRYSSYGFSFLNNWIANEILRKSSNNPDSLIAMEVFPMKKSAYTQDDYSLLLSTLLPFFMLLMYILPIYRMLSRIVSEKETQAKESMKIMGLTEFSYWMSWFTYYFILVTIISACSLGIISINVIVNSNKFLIFCYFWVYGISLFGLIMLFQAIFNRATTAAIAGTLIYFGTAFVDFAIGNQSVGKALKYGLSILTPIAVSRGANNISAFESSGIGLQFYNVNDEYQNYKLSISFILQVASLFIFTILGLYLDNVLPGVNGRTRPFYFFLKPSYWCGSKKKVREVSPARYRESEEDQETFIFETKYIQRDYYEPVSNDMKRQELDNKILIIRELKKTYPNGFKAVRGLNVKMYNGQIFALLGHNGAGKTTTISMLTGLIQSSAGIAEVFGIDMFNDIDKVRKFLGVCPQHDVLFDLLTPIEHLQLFCDFKGVDKKLQKQQIQKMLKDVDLLAHKSTMAKNLSGGNRRKLSVAIALIGGSKLVLLDEPTAGMDLNARRKLWNMLKNYRHNRIIILTTHYMDEADILGDRIGIMTGGQLVCLGTSLFLKNRFGVGYNLTMVKKDKTTNTKVIGFIEEHLGQVKKLHEVSSEIAFQIPNSLSYKFKEFFEAFDQNMDSLDIISYGISVTTLEEVFLKAGTMVAGINNKYHIPDEVELKDMKDGKQVDSANDISQSSGLSDLDSFCISEQNEKRHGIFFIHLMAVFRKRYYIYRRNYKSLLIEILIPIILVIIGFSFSKAKFFFNSPPRDLNPTLYPAIQRLIVNTELVAKQQINDISPQQLIESLPDYQQIFSVQYNDYTSLNNTEKLEKYDQDIFYSRDVGRDVPQMYGSYFIYEANNVTKQFKVATFLNITSQDSTAFFPQFMYESILKQATGNPDFKFRVTNAPFPVTQRLKNGAANINGVFIVFVLSIGFALIPASIVSYILNERENNLKHMQLISGMNLSSYWVSNYIFDILKAYIPVGVTIGLIYAFRLNYNNIWTVFLLYPFGVIPFTYATSFFFKNESVAQTTTIFLHFVFSGLGAIIVFVLRIIESTYFIGDNLLWIIKIIPSFCLTNSLMFISSKAQLKLQRPDLSNDDFNIINLKGDLMLLAIHFFVWTTFLIIVESNIIYKIWHKLPCSRHRAKPRQAIDQDEDVIEEENRVAQTSKDNMKVRVYKFRKEYKTLFKKPFCAVENTSFGLEYGECFALLGVNGAGKSTTFKSLTNQIVATSGEITINGMDVGADFSHVRKQIGYCPQHDAIFNLMTVEEHLEYYASIKGIYGEQKNALIEKHIVEMDLEEHRKKPAGSLSGGNKRKLSVAMATLGNPPIILLDEPSAGMDPEARRFMWSVVAKISQQKKKCAVILTTHSMEEAEALSTKMGIMVKGGVFRCFGNSQHIKDKYGTGYELELKVRKLKPREISQKAVSYTLSPETEHIPLAQCIEIMKNEDVDQFLIDEIKDGGLGSDIFSEAKDQQGMVQLKNFITWLNVEQYGQIIIKSLLQGFQKVEMLEHYNDYYKIRVPRQDKSIGYVFGMIEERKEEYGISEYSVSQTTLEQIFQRFAQLEVDAVKGTTFEQLPDGQIGRKESMPHLESTSSIQVNTNRQVSVDHNPEI